MVRNELLSCHRLYMSNLTCIDMYIPVHEYGFLIVYTFGSMCTRCLTGLPRTFLSQFLFGCCLFVYEELHGISVQARFMRRHNKQGRLLCTCCDWSGLNTSLCSSLWFACLSVKVFTCPRLGLLSNIRSQYLAEFRASQSVHVAWWRIRKRAPRARASSFGL